MHATLHERSVRDVIADWASVHRLSEGDAETLRNAVADYEPDQVRRQLKVRLRKVLARRAVATLPLEAAARYLNGVGLAASLQAATAAVAEVNRLAAVHGMEVGERTGLCAVLAEVPEAEWGDELDYEVRGVLAARRVGGMTLPTQDELQVLRRAMAGNDLLPPFAYPND